MKLMILGMLIVGFFGTSLATTTGIKAPQRFDTVEWLIINCPGMGPENRRMIPATDLKLYTCYNHKPILKTDVPDEPPKKRII